MRPMKALPDPSERTCQLSPPSVEANVPTPVANESSPTETKKQLAQNTDPLLQRDENVATQHNVSQEHAVATKARRHGGAMPQ